jgi:hypothetical protein
MLNATIKICVHLLPCNRVLFQHLELASLQATARAKFAVIARTYRSSGMVTSSRLVRSSVIHNAQPSCTSRKRPGENLACTRHCNPSAQRIVLAYSNTQLHSVASLHTGTKGLSGSDGVGTADADTIAAIVAGMLHPFYLSLQEIPKVHKLPLILFDSVRPT